MNNFANTRDGLHLHRLPRGQHDDAGGDALGFGQEEAGIRLQGAIRLHFVAAWPEVFTGNDVFRMERFHDFIAVARVMKLNLFNARSICINSLFVMSSETSALHAAFKNPFFGGISIRG